MGSRKTKYPSHMFYYNFTMMCPGWGLSAVIKQPSPSPFTITSWRALLVSTSITGDEMSTQNETGEVSIKWQIRHLTMLASGTPSLEHSKPFTLIHLIDACFNPETYAFDPKSIHFPYYFCAHSHRFQARSGFCKCSHNIVQILFCFLLCCTTELAT